MKRKDKSINLDEVHEYEKTKNLVESDYDNVINKLDQDTYLRLKKIKDIHKKWKNNMLCAIGSIGLIFFSAFVISIWGLFMHPIFFFALLCEPAIAILSASFYKDAKKHENYNNLYKFLKKNQKWDKSEEYLKSFEKSNHIMNEDRLERFNFAENRYNHAIESVSKDIAIFEQDRNKVLEEIDIRPEDKITLVEGDQTKEFSSLSSALPLIARMIKDKKIVITVKEENQAIDNAFDNTCSNTLSAEFHEDKKRYEYNKSKRELNKAIDDASRDIEEKEREEAHLSKVAEVEENEERLIVVADELGTVRNCDKLGTALPLIAKMLERYKKIEVVPVENVKTPVENTETEQDLDEEHKSIFGGINFGDLDD